MPIQQIGFQGRPPVFTWATKPAANAVPVGYTITIPEFSHSDWYSNGTYWRPVGGRAVMRNWVGANVTFSVSGSTSTIIAGVPGLLFPADLVATPGLSVRNRVAFHREAAAAAANQTANFRVGVGANSRLFGNINITGNAANQKFLLDESRTVNTGLSTFSIVSNVGGMPAATESYDPQPLTLLSGQTVQLSGFGVDTGGSDVWYFDQWLTEIYA